MTVVISVHGGTQATGVLSAVGAAEKYGYAPGEKILDLTADDFGNWVGKLEWRSVSGVVRWDPINIVATAGELDAVITTDKCFQHMPRVTTPR